MKDIFSLNDIKAKIKAWSRGQYIPPPENEEDSPVAKISPGHYKQPLIIKCFKQIIQFWSVHWKWILIFLVAIATFIVSLIALIRT